MLLTRELEPRNRESSRRRQTGSAAAIPASHDRGPMGLAGDASPDPATGNRAMSRRSRRGKQSRKNSPQELDRAAANYLEGEDQARNLAFICSVCRPRILRYFERKRIPLPDREDLTQDTLIRVSSNLAAFRGDCPVLAYIFSIAANVRKHWIRDRERNRSQVSFDQEESVREEPEDPSRSPEEQAERRELLALMDREIAKLPPQMRVCFELRIHQGLTYREIADVLDSTPSTVGVNIKNAKDRLKKRLEDYLDRNDRGCGDSDQQG